MPVFAPVTMIVRAERSRPATTSSAVVFEPNVREPNLILPFAALDIAVLAFGLVAGKNCITLRRGFVTKDTERSPNLLASTSASRFAYMQRTRSLLRGAGLCAVSMGVTSRRSPSRAPPRIAQSRLVLITTAARFDSTLGDQGPGAAYNAGAKFYSLIACRSSLCPICASLTLRTIESTRRPPIRIPGCP